MARHVTYTETLFFYDSHQVFVATDAVGTRYLALLVSQDEESDRYAASAISEGRLSDFKSGREELRSILLEPEVEEFYTLTIDATGDLNSLELKPVELFQEEWIPEAGFYLDPMPDANAELIAQEAIGKQRSILHLAVSPPETRNETRIDAYHLAEALDVFQSVVKHAYKKSISSLSKATKRLLSDDENYGLDVFAFSPGSFKVHLQSKVPSDLAGYVNIEHAFRLIDEITECMEDPAAAAELLQKHRGHLASSVKRLLGYVVLNSASLSYEWFSPGGVEPINRRIPVGRATELYDLLSRGEDISVETLELVGKLIKANTTTGAWTVLSSEDGKEYSGRIMKDAEATLRGLVLQGPEYKFVCEERIVGYVAAGHEKKQISALHIEEVAP